MSKTAPPITDLELGPLGLVADGEVPITDEELTALALASDPEAPLSPDAVPLDLYPDHDAGCLPLAYMPPAMSRTAGRWRVPVAVLIVMAFLAIDILGLCITYGTLVAA